MPTATVTSKGQITIPVEVRKELGLKAGDRVDFFPGARGGYEMRARNLSVRDLAGMFPRVSRVVSLEEMDEAIARGAAGLPEPKAASGEEDAA
jgi:AbrB family looped-hinge helix DNA binding protein